MSADDTKKKRTEFRIAGMFVPHIQDLWESPVLDALLFSEWKALRCLEIEWMRRGGPKCTRTLIVTFAQFHKGGVRYNATAPAIRVLTALGLIKVAQQGRAGNSEFRRASQYILTYVPTVDCPVPTDEWRQITTIDDAKMIAKGARRKGSNSASFKKQNPSPQNDSVCNTETIASVTTETIVSRYQNDSETSLSKRYHSTRSSPFPGLAEPPQQPPEPKPTPKPKPKAEPVAVIAVTGNGNGAVPPLSVKADPASIAAAEVVRAQLVAERDRLNSQRSLMPAEDARLRQLVSEIENLQGQIRTAKLMV